MVRLVSLLVLLAAGCAWASREPVRFASFNAAMSRDAPGELLAAMRTPNDPRGRAVAAVIQAARPDVLILQEFDHGGDYDPNGEALRLFQQNYLGVAQQDDLDPIGYEHVYLAPSNTGLPTGLDLNGDGLVAPEPGAAIGTRAYAADCHGFGLFPGHYAYVILSKHPIDRDGIRTFQEMLWKDLPGNDIPPDFYSDKALEVLRLSSKNHVNVPIVIGDETIRVLAAHPTPPVFDGPEDRNGRRNADEIRLLRRLAEGAGPLVATGDLNADPFDGEARRDAMATLLDDEQINAVVLPTSPGGLAAALRDGGANADHEGDPAADTADWNDRPGGPGNLRVDYVLPSADLNVFGSGVFWPTEDEPLLGVSLTTVEAASDHRLVWVDVLVH
jgi:endonuclease/exonuclease/phosphatase family metal-dependent hydrolase